MAGNVAHVVGARPNFVKAAPVIAALRDLGVSQTLVHTGQHYDERMSDVFFRDLGLPAADVNLGIGSGSHARQTAALMVALETTFVDAPPVLVVVYGDVNSTLAAALVASKLGIPIAHVEAGLRSFDDSMPEEINRRIVDTVSDLLLVTSPEGVENLRSTGVAADRIHLVGNPMIDSLRAHLDHFEPPRIMAALDVTAPYAVATIHRPSNVDGATQAGRVVAMLRDVSSLLPIVLPLHPRGRATLEAAGLLDLPGIRVAEPFGYADFISLVRGATVAITDSGGVQEETTMLDVPCLTVRPNTERPITITHGTNRLVPMEAVPDAVRRILAGDDKSPTHRPPLWDGLAGRRIADVIAAWLAQRGDTAAGE